MEVATYSIVPENAEQLAEVYRLEADRLARDSRSTGRPAGARLSISCPVRRVKAVFDPWFETPIDPGVGWRGHMLESYALAVLLADRTYTAQAPLEWSHGVSAWDAIVDPMEGSPFAGYIDWKSTSGSPRPSSANRAQAEVMMVAAGFEPGAALDHWLLSVSNWTATGPFTHVLTDEAHAQRTRELAGTATAIDYLTALQAAGTNPGDSDEWNTPAWWLEHGLACACGGCIPYATYDANNALEKLWFRYEIAHDTEAEGKRAKEAIRRKLIEAAELLCRDDIEAGRKAQVLTWGGDGGKITRQLSGSWTVGRNKPAAEADAA